MPIELKQTYNYASGSLIFIDSYQLLIDVSHKKLHLSLSEIFDMLMLLHKHKHTDFLSPNKTLSLFEHPPFVEFLDLHWK